MTDYGVAIFGQHAAMLEASGIPPEHARARGYVSVDTKRRLEQIKVTPKGRRVPGLLVPLHRVDGSIWGYQYRPDSPRVNDAGKPIKYETPSRQPNGIDVPPGVADKLGDPTVPLWITEGSKKADCAAVHGLCCVALMGVWSWRGANAVGGKVSIADWHDIALNGRRVIIAFDGDVSCKHAVHKAMVELAGYLRSKGASVAFLHLPDTDDKTGLDDYLTEHSLEDLHRLVKPDPPAVAESKSRPAPPAVTGTAAPSVPPPPEDAAAMVDAIADMLTRYVAFPSGEARDAVALWVVHTHVVSAFDSTPRVALLSPEPQSGKTRTLEVVELLAHAPMFTSNTTVAVLARTIDAYGSTVLLDECDTVFGSKAKDHEELRAILNSGHRNGATYDRMVGEGAGMEAKRFAVFAPVALAGIGDLPETVMQRSVVVPMRRRARSERVEPFRRRLALAEAEPIKHQLIGWAAANLDKLRESWPIMPEGITDRPADVWEPLLAVADLVGRDWPARARAACVRIVAAAQNTDTGSLGVRLLADVRRVLEGAGVDRMATDDLLDGLHALDEAPWSDLRGKPLDPRGLANRLRGYGVHSHQIKVEGKNVRGYSVAGTDKDGGGLYDAFTRYLPDRETEANTEAAPSEKSATAATAATPQVTGGFPGSGQVAGSANAPLPATEALPEKPPLTRDVAPVADVAPISEGAADPVTECTVCGGPLHRLLIENGTTVHPTCEESAL